MTPDDRRADKAARWQVWVANNRERHAANQKRWNEDNREHRKAYMKAYHATNRRRQRVAKYGLTIEAYDTMVAAQGGGCAVCGRIPRYELVPDHDHDTGQIRGLLCQGCNAGIGYLGDTFEAVERAAEYLAAARQRAAVWTDAA